MHIRRSSSEVLIYGRPCKAAKDPVWPLGRTIHLIESRQAAVSGSDTLEPLQIEYDILFK